MSRSNGVFFIVAEGQEFLVYWASGSVMVRSPCLSVVRVLEFSDRGISQIGS